MRSGRLCGGVNTQTESPLCAWTLWVGQSRSLVAACVAPAGEAQLVMQLLSGLLAAGVPGGDVGIISPYKAQVRMGAGSTSCSTSAESCRSPSAESCRSPLAWCRGGGACMAALEQLLRPLVAL